MGSIRSLIDNCFTSLRLGSNVAHSRVRIVTTFVLSPIEVTPIQLNWRPERARLRRIPASE